MLVLKFKLTARVEIVTEALTLVLIPRMTVLRNDNGKGNNRCPIVHSHSNGQCACLNHAFAGTCSKSSRNSVARAMAIARVLPL